MPTKRVLFHCGFRSIFRCLHDVVIPWDLSFPACLPHHVLIMTIAKSRHPLLGHSCLSSLTSSIVGQHLATNWSRYVKFSESSKSMVERLVGIKKYANLLPDHLTPYLQLCCCEVQNRVCASMCMESTLSVSPHGSGLPLHQVR